MRGLIKNTLFRVGSQMRNSPFFYSLNQYRSSLRYKRVQKDTGLCIEGFQRSGNTYFELRFELSNSDVKLSHHIHGVANIKKAIKLGVPVIVLIREPGDALASLLTYDSNLSAYTAIQAYIDYYTEVLRIKEKCFILHFNELIIDFNQQVDRINRRFSTDFSRCILSDDNLQKIMNERQDKYKNKNATPYPSELKKKFNARHKEQIISDTRYPVALSIYHKFLA